MRQQYAEARRVKSAIMAERERQDREAVKLRRLEALEARARRELGAAEARESAAKADATALRAEVRGSTEKAASDSADGTWRTA